MQRGMQYEREKDRTPKMQGLRISSRIYAVAFLIPIYRWLIRKSILKLLVHILGNWSPAPDRLYPWAIYLPLFYSVPCLSLSLHLTHSLSPISLFFPLSTLLSLSLLVSLSYRFLSLFFHLSSIIFLSKAILKSEAIIALQQSRDCQSQAQSELERKFAREREMVCLTFLLFIFDYLILLVLRFVADLLMLTTTPIDVYEKLSDRWMDG